MSDGGKGSAPRPIPDPQKFRDNWDKIFGKKTKEEPIGKPLKDEPLKDEDHD